jgi:hypothetical protein
VQNTGRFVCHSAWQPKGRLNVESWNISENAAGSGLAFVDVLLKGVRGNVPHALMFKRLKFWPEFVDAAKMNTGDYGGLHQGKTGRIVCRTAHLNKLGFLLLV